MLLTILAIFLACLILLLTVLSLMSPGKVKPILDESGNPLAGSLSEKIRVEINGVQQGMFIQSQDPGNPVLLFLHGGPGMPEYFLTEQYPTGLEEIFTMVWWDQRGAGLSYSPDIPADSMTVEQMIADTIAVTNYLRERFGQDKIYLMAHSGGSFYGLQVAARAPELYHAYIGMGQVTYQLGSEHLAYDYMLEQYRLNGNTAMVEKLKAAPLNDTMPLPAAYDRMRDGAMHELGIGTTRDMDSVVTGVFLPSWRSPQLTLIEKVNLWRGKIYSAGLLRNEVFGTDLTQKITSLQIPVYFVHGIYDYTVCYSLSKDYFDKLEAPLKGFYTFDQSAHTPMFEEPERMRQILREDVLRGTTTLADTN